jgi:uncharacterized repeat protein (TIGR01451 family)
MKSAVWRSLLSGTAAIVIAGQAEAQTATPNGTAAGTTITNTASATYSVNGTAASVQSNPSSFKVDRKVDFTVVAQTGTTKVNLNDTDAVLTFTVTNKTNGVQDFRLLPEQALLGIGLLGTDNFNVNDLRTFVDSNGNGTYEPGQDAATFIDELAPDGQATVFIVANVPNVPTAAFATASLRVIAAAGGAGSTQGDVLIPNLLGDRAGEEDIVFADNDSDEGVLGGDIARNGQGLAYAQYEIGARTVELSILKSSRVISDPVNGESLVAKALPGAVMEYCLLVRNSTLLVPASNIVLTDEIPANTTYVPGSIRVGGTCLLPGEAQDDDADDANDNRVYAGSFTQNGTTNVVSATIPTLNGASALAATFRVTVN